MLYETFINKLNSHKIFGVNFNIKGFAHYNQCRIFHQVDIMNNKEIVLIVCQLTEDDYEKVSFLNKFDEKYKLFDFGRKGRFTLKQVWNKVCITEVVYAE